MLVYEIFTVLVVGPAHRRYQELLAVPDPFDLHILRDEVFITMNLGRDFIDRTYDICQRAGFFPRSNFQTDDFVAKIAAVREGIGVTFLPESKLQEASYLCPGLKACYPDIKNNRRTIYLMRRKESMLSDAATDFWNFVMNHYEKPEALINIPG